MNLNQKHQWAKVASIPVLAIVLYFVWPKSEKVELTTLNVSETHSSTDRTASRRENSSRRENPSTNEAPITNLEWPAFTSRDIVDLDPFDKGMIFPELAPKDPVVDSKDSVDQKLVSAPARTQQTMVSPTKIQAIFQSPKGVAALVDTKVVHVGDRLSDGMEVIEITPEQLIVSAPSGE